MHKNKKRGDLVNVWAMGYKLKICCLIHRMRNETDSIPDIFLDVLTPASRIHNHNTRFVSNLNYFRPRVSTNLGKTSFKSGCQRKPGKMLKMSTEGGQQN